MIAIAKAVNGSFEGVKYPNNKEKLFTDKDGKVCQKFYNLTSNNPSENWEEMKAIAKLSNIKNKFLVAVLSPTEEQSKNLQFSDWKTMAENYAKTFGFYENQWRWDVHGNTNEKHLHIYASRIEFSGKNSVKEARIGLRSGNWAEKYSKNIGWKTLEEILQDKKTLTKEILVDALKKSKNFAEVRSEMEKRGFTFQLSFSNKTDGEKSLNGMRIMKISDAEKRKIREEATNLAVKNGRELLPINIRNKPTLTPEELEKAKELGKEKLPMEIQMLVLSKAEFKAKPGFTLSELDRDKKNRITIGNIVQILEKNSQKQHQNNSFSENPFSEKSEEKTINLNISNNFLLIKLLEGFLKESYVSAEEDKLKKKRKYISSGFSR